MNKLQCCLVLAALIGVQRAAAGHGVTVNVDLSADGTRLIVDRPVYADRDITAITNLDQSLGYDKDDDAPGFEFSGNVLARGGVISLKIVGPLHFWNPTGQLQAQTSSSVVLDSLFYFSPAAGSVGPAGESVVGQTAISSTAPIVLYDPAAPPASDHHFAAYDLTAGAGGGDPSPGAFGLWVELVSAMPTGTINSKPFLIGVNNGLTHSTSSFGAAGDGDHQQPSGDGTQYGAAVAAFQVQMANVATWDSNGSGSYSTAAKWDGNPLQGAANAGTIVVFGNGSNTAINVASATVTIDAASTVGSLLFDNVGGTNYTLASDGVNGHGFTMNNHGAGASINVLGGSHVISAPLKLAEPTVFNVASGATLALSGGSISEGSLGTPVYLTGGGLLSLRAASLYSGPTVVSGGTLQTVGQGSIGTGPLVLDTGNFVASNVEAGHSQAVAALQIRGDGTGSATIAVAAGQTLTIQQSIVQDAATTLHVSGQGRVVVAANDGNAVESGATIVVTPQSTLELAGSVSGVGPAINLINNGSEAAGGGFVVSGTNQQIGNLDGTGTVLIAAGGDLTANHVIQDALIIEGTASAHGVFTIAESSPAMAATAIAREHSVPEPSTAALAILAVLTGAVLAARYRDVHSTRK